MADIRNTGIFADTSSGGGLFRGYLRTDTTTDVASVARNTKVPGVPIGLVALREGTGYFNDFRDETNEVNLSNLYEALDVGTQTVNPSVFAMDGEGNGVMRLTSDATDGDGNSVSRNQVTQLPMCIAPVAGRVCVFETRVRCSSWDTIHWFAGILESTGSTILITANGDMISGLEYVGFHYNDDDDTAGVPTLVAAGANNTEVTTTPVDRQGVATTISALTDDQWYRFGIRIEGTDNIEWYIDDELVGAAVLASPFTGNTGAGAVGLYTSWGSVMNSAATVTFDVDYELTWQSRE